MAVDTQATFWLGLLAISLGTGLLKPNISGMVGQALRRGRHEAGRRLLAVLHGHQHRLTARAADLRHARRAVQLALGIRGGRDRHDHRPDPVRGGAAQPAGRRRRCGESGRCCRAADCCGDRCRSAGDRLRPDPAVVAARSGPGDGNHQRHHDLHPAGAAVVLPQGSRPSRPRRHSALARARIRLGVPGRGLLLDDLRAGRVHAHPLRRSGDEPDPGHGVHRAGLLVAVGEPAASS